LSRNGENRRGKDFFGILDMYNTSAEELFEDIKEYDLELSQAEINIR
jgi:hypothetical protein